MLLVHLQSLQFRHIFKSTRFDVCDRIVSHISKNKIIISYKYLAELSTIYHATYNRLIVLSAGNMPGFSELNLFLTKDLKQTKKHNNAK